MGEMGTDYLTSLQVFEGAKRFGLTDGEVLQTVDESLCEIESDTTVAEFLDELSGALARNIICKQQRTLSRERSADPTELP
jgi:hypothetical protein